MDNRLFYLIFSLILATMMFYKNKFDFINAILVIGFTILFYIILNIGNMSENFSNIIPKFNIKPIESSLTPTGQNQSVVEDLLYSGSPNFGTINNFPNLNNFDYWKMQLRFNLNPNSQNKWQSIIGNMYNGQVSRGWGLWINPQKLLHWSWANSFIDLTQLGRISEGMDYLLTIESGEGKLLFTLKGISFETVFSKGTYGAFDAGKERTDHLFKEYNVFKRECTDCDPSYSQMFYYRITPIPESLSIYEIIKETWSGGNNQINEDFVLYNNFNDLMRGEKTWLFCNYDDPGIAFPRDCGVYGMGLPWQWNSEQFGGITNFKYSIPVSSVKTQTINSGSNTITTNVGVTTLGGSWLNYPNAENFEGKIWDLQVFQLIFDDLETTPNPPCGSGYWQQGNKCLQVCSNNNQVRNDEGYCICNKGGNDQSCASNFGFSCFKNLCRRTLKRAASYQSQCN